MRTIHLMEPYIPPGTIEGVSRTLATRWIGQGPKVDEFERKFSTLMQGRPSVAVGSCTDALHLSYILAGIRDGSEVIAPLFTCTATNIPLLYQRARIKFCDVAPDSLNMDPAAVEELITEETKAIVVVHYGGMPIDQRIFRIAEAYQIPVIEDCAQALGAQVGQRGKFACYSFQAVKHITTGDGGMLVLPEALRAKAKRLRWFGIDREAKFNGTWENDITEIGYKYQMTDVGAAMGLAGLESLDFQLKHRRALRESYRDGLEGVDGIRLLDLDYGSACWLCTVAVERREDFRRKLKENGIESDLTHYRNDRYTIFDDHVAGERFPNMDAIDSKYLVIPLHMGMTVEDVERICDVVRGGW